jgi:hypothetical protein
MYIYKHILTESAFTEDLIIFEFYNTRRLHQSLDYGTLIIILQKKWHKIRITFGFLKPKLSHFNQDNRISN